MLTQSVFTGQSWPPLVHSSISRLEIGWASINLSKHEVVASLRIWLLHEHYLIGAYFLQEQDLHGRGIPIQYVVVSLI